MLVRDNYSMIMQHILATDPAQKSKVDADLKELGATITKELELYEKAESINKNSDASLLSDIKATRQALLKVREEKIFPLSRAHKTDEALAMVAQELDPVYKAYVNAVAKATAASGQQALDASASIQTTVSSSEWVIMVALSVVFAAGIGVALFITRSTSKVLRDTVGELSAGAEQVSSASAQVAGASQSLSQGATTQAAALEETSASMEEMASMTRKNAENSHQAAAMMAETERLVSGANGALNDMVESMTAIKDSSDKVSKIIKTIDEIAFQTNILALNAAVEAARAGEAGMGFAVVADEVRALAQRSAQAAKDTAVLIEESIAKSNEGQTKVQQVSGAIDSITESTVKVKGLIDEVSVASQQQSQGIDQVSQAIAQMEKVTQGTAATAEESAAASEELNAQAETSMALVSGLAQLVGGVNTAG
jgi:methyl-accepting chemotaxis protein